MIAIVAWVIGGLVVSLVVAVVAGKAIALGQERDQ